MEAAEVANILTDFRSVKLKPAQRAFVDRARATFESTGFLPLEVRLRLRRLRTQYHAQIAELERARERARITNGLRRAGLTRSEAAKLRDARVQGEERGRADLGI